MKNNHLILFLLIGGLLFAQQNIDWDRLADVRFEEQLDEEYGAYFTKPYFGDSVKILHGKRILIKGYFLDLDPEGKMFILSKFPMKSCFFCGGGGLESIMNLGLKEKPIFKTDDVLEVTGTLILNDSNPFLFNYILKDTQCKKIDP